jgi:hypothetical protein
VRRRRLRSLVDGGTANHAIQESPEEEKWIFFSNGEFDIADAVKFTDRRIASMPTGGSNSSLFLSLPVRYVCQEDTLLYSTKPDIGTLMFHHVSDDSTP